MPDKNIIRLSSYFIKNDIDSLNDLPLELSNTVANIYYNAIHQILEEKFNETELVKIKAEEIEPFLKSKENHFLDDMELIKRMIKSFREIKVNEKQRDAHFISMLIIDEIKYKIETPHKKSFLLRWCLRFFRRKKVLEIENLNQLIT